MLELFEQNMIVGISLLVGVAFAVIAVVMVLVLTRAHAKLQLGKRIALATNGNTSVGAGGGDNKKVAQKRLLVQSKINEIEATTKTKKFDRPDTGRRLEMAGMKLSPKSFHLVSAVLALSSFLAVLLIGIGFLPGILAAVTMGLGVPRYYVARKTKRRMKAFVDAFPDAVDVIVRGIKSGLPLGECMVIVGNEAELPVCTEFKEIMESMRLGLPLDKAMERAVKRIPISEFRFFTIVLTIQSETGGNLAETLQNLSNILRARKKMKAKVVAMASEARTSAMVIGCLPFLMAALLYATSPEYISVLFTNPMGQIMIAGGLASMTIGLLVMSKMVDFKI